MSFAMQQTLSTSSNFANPDAAYRMIVEAHRGLSDEDSAALDAALVLLLANHIGNLAVLKEALKQAAQTLSSKASAGQ
jgi:predicted metal-dependent hydrolase